MKRILALAICAKIDQLLQSREDHIGMLHEANIALNLAQKKQRVMTQRCFLRIQHKSSYIARERVENESSVNRDHITSA